MNGLMREPWLTLRGATVGALPLAVALGVLSDLLFLAALQFRPDWFADPALLVAGGSASAELLKWPPSRTCSATTFRRPSSPWHSG
jgi:hypothetical protein